MMRRALGLGMNRHPGSRAPLRARPALVRAGLVFAYLLSAMACQQTTSPVADVAPQRVALEIRRDYKGCSETIAAKAEYQPLARKLALASSDPSASRYSSWAAHAVSPRQSEIELLTALRDDLQACRKIALDDAAARPLDRKALADAFAADDATWIEALAGRLTWGALNGRLRTTAMLLQAHLAQANAPPARQAAVPTTTDAGNAKSKSNAPKPAAARTFSIDVGPQPDSTLPDWANRQREQRPAIHIHRDRSIYCDNFAHTKYCQH
jgi:hypothetical protein